MEEGEAGVPVFNDDDGGEGGDEVGDGGEVGREVDADGEGDEEEAAEEEHLVAAEVPAGHPHRDEEDDARRHDAQLHGTDHLLRQMQQTATSNRIIPRETPNSPNQN